MIESTDTTIRKRSLAEEMARDNGDCARQVYARVIAALNPSERVEHEVTRGRLPVEA